MLQQSCCYFIIGLFLGIQNANSILNRGDRIVNKVVESQNGNRLYLNTKRPLWILDDSVKRKDVERRPIIRHLSNQRRQTNLSRRLTLPNHYNFPLSWNRARYMRHASDGKMQQRHATKLMPQFDSFPGQDNADAVPMFVYNGPKGELLLNTMLSTKKYPMLEPVPGETLYPPITPIFRPKPIVERYRVNGKRALPLNLTLIPYYAHEAIDPRTLESLHEAKDATQTTTVMPSIFYATSPQHTSSSAPSSRRSKQNKSSSWQKYKVYHSKDEVQWLPSVSIELPPQSTTPFPLALASPPTLRNHRYNQESDSLTTNKPLSHYRSMLDDAGNYRVIYADENLDGKSTLTTSEEESRRSSNYVASKEIFAFPVFTLGKLLTTEKHSKEPEPDEKDESLAKEKYDGRSLEQEDASDNWFVLQSRCKGSLNDLRGQRYSSKYVKNPKSSTTAKDFVGYDVGNTKSSSR